MLPRGKQAPQLCQLGGSVLIVRSQASKNGSIWSSARSSDQPPNRPKQKQN